MRSVGLGLAKVVGRPALSPRFVAARCRFNHTDSHDLEDTTTYPKEGFGSSAWGGVVLFSTLVVAFYKFAPAPGEDNIITRYISYYSTPKEVWEHANIHHTILSQDASEAQQIIWGAKQPAVHRYRYPQMIDQSLPHRQPVGSSVDLNSVAVKRPNE